MPATITPPDLFDELTDLGREQGLAAGLRRILGNAVPAPRTASGLALVPRGSCGAEAVATGPRTDPLVAAAGLELVRFADPAAQSDPRDVPDLALMLAAVRLGVTSRLLDLAVDHLSARRVEEAALIDKPLLRAQIADAVADLELCRHGLRTATTPAAAEALHACLARTAWSISTLFGASGYVLDHAARELYAAELVHSAWVGSAIDHVVGEA
ncbi:acyl-CoA dehydrogenase family protein [Actinospica robiniae]|uniref:acyl-CoA dehydrogenase family protein n=1 Tax=Actinospica robiniae TaxID=304901 RepID=UPI0004190A26|nr:acyl-CoA dehydrogenase family protein [Actinospica robiniae]